MMNDSDHSSPQQPVTVSSCPLPNPAARDCGPVYKDWYTTSEPLPKWWSCDWHKWAFKSFFEPLGNLAQFYGDPRIEAVVTLNIGFGIAGKTEPLAFHTQGHGDFLFVANGIYYDYAPSNEVVYRCNQEKYASHLDFIWRSEKAPSAELHRVRPWPYGSGYADDEGNPTHEE
ncbi:hypothetical protein B0H19DRAFT_1232198 [Mycena capillaripes]|nr:hypothetical protein B0H19DRAFT_1232198 [Mycena capillaripes]